MEKITVVITHEDLEDCLTIDSLLIRRFRDSGIPVKGVMLLKGVSNGSLTSVSDYCNKELVYTWEGDRTLDKHTNK